MSEGVAIGAWRRVDRMVAAYGVFVVVVAATRLDRPGVGEVCVYPSRPGQVGGGGSSDGGGAPRTAAVTGAGFDDVVGGLRLALKAQEQVG